MANDSVGMAQVDVAELLEQALKNLLEHDRYLLEIDVNERSLTHKLAEHIQQLCPAWHVDCEYNRDGAKDLPKYLKYGPSAFTTEDDTNAKTVFPDIIVHQRGTDENLLVMEVKKSSNGDKGNSDRDKLGAFQKKPFCYAYAAFIRLIVGRQPTYKVEWIEALPEKT